MGGPELAAAGEQGSGGGRRLEFGGRGGRGVGHGDQGSWFLGGYRGHGGGQFGGRGWVFGLAVWG